MEQYDRDIFDHLDDFSTEELLGRKSRRIDLSKISDFICNKNVLVTGGGGSIGSELCRQIAKNQPKQLIIFDIYENSSYGLQRELMERYPDLNLTVQIGSVRDLLKLLDLFEKFRPDIVFHAAAHKHVPLMEDSPCEAIKNNVGGTYKTALAAAAFGAERFVLISTDKAVNPTSVMGASKRICEQVIQAFDRLMKEGEQGQILELADCDGESECKAMLAERMRDAKTDLVAVRFGNVLGSNGSVIPIFQRQIARGGPVTVTHPDMTRFFMTIPEAASLVLQAGSYARGGEIFILDMGEPVRIDDLARKMICLAGYKPGVDIKIQYTGLRPGEKLYEEKLMAEEGIRKTPNNLIYIASPIHFDPAAFLAQIQHLQILAMQNAEAMTEAIRQAVPTFRPLSMNERKDEKREGSPPDLDSDGKGL